MQPVDVTFDLGNYRYTQIERMGDIAVYRQEHKQALVTRYEVVRIRVMPEHTWPNGDVTPEHEFYPSASAWGREGWTCFTLEEAQAQARSLASDSLTANEVSGRVLTVGR